MKETVQGEDKEEVSPLAFRLAQCVLTGFFKKALEYFGIVAGMRCMCVLCMCVTGGGGVLLLGMPAPALGSAELGYGVRGAGPFCVSNTV